jgi:hypothetical protein
MRSVTACRLFSSGKGEVRRFQQVGQIKNEVPSFDDGMVERLKKAGYSVGSQRTTAA